jgi:hypothetical protein
VVDRACSRGGRVEKCKQYFGWKTHFHELGIDVKIILEWILGKWSERVWTGCIWLRIGTNGGVL